MSVVVADLYNAMVNNESNVVDGVLHKPMSL